MARPPNPYRTRKVHISVPESLMAEVELRLFDSARGRIPHGRLSQLFTQLLLNWLEEERKGGRK